MQDVNFEDGIKMLATGEWVPISTPTKHGINGRVLLTQEEIEFFLQEESEFKAERIKRETKSKILSLEAMQTPRRIREAIMGIQESVDFINEIESEIVLLRNQL